MHTLCALGSFAIGSAFWGALSDVVGLQAALTHRGRWRWLAGLLLARPFPLRMGEAAGGDAGHAAGKTCSSPHEPDPEAGPVAVEIGYRIRAERRDGLPRRAEPAARAAPARRRDLLARLPRPGATRRATVERFIVTSAGPTTCTSARARRWPTRSSRRACAPSAAGRGGDDAALHRRALNAAGVAESMSLVSVVRWMCRLTYARAHFVTVSSVRVVISLPKVRSSRVMNTGPLSLGK